MALTVFTGFLSAAATAAYAKTTAALVTGKVPPATNHKKPTGKSSKSFRLPVSRSVFFMTAANGIVKYETCAPETAIRCANPALARLLFVCLSSSPVSPVITALTDAANPPSRYFARHEDTAARTFEEARLSDINA